MIRRCLAALVAVLVLAPLGVAAQTITYSPNTIPLSAGGVSLGNVFGSVVVTSTGLIGFSSSSTDPTVAADVNLRRDAANILAQYSGTSAQGHRTYNTRTDSSNGEWGAFDWTTTANVLTIGTTKNGTGSTRAINLVIGGTAAWQIDTTGKIADQGSHSLQANSQILGGDIVAGVGKLIAVASSTQWRAASDGVFVMEKTAGSGAQPIVSGLATCNSGNKGGRSMVTDATVAASGNFGAAVTGGSSNIVPVYCDGTSWKIGQAEMQSYWQLQQLLQTLPPVPVNDNLPAADRLRAFG